MTETPPVEILLERRRLRRALSVWRLLALGLGIVAVIAVAARFGGLSSKMSPHIARIEIKGLITGDRDTVKLIDELADSRARAVIVSISSPGGTVSGSQRIYDALRRLDAKKPVVAVVDGLAASGAYIAALGADRIFADDNALVGSIGVLFEYPNVYKLLDMVGVKVETIKSAPLKAAPNGFEPTSEAARAAINALVVDSYDWFKNLVKERRQMTEAELAAVDDGRVFTGHMGLPLKLVDDNGGERAAIHWLESAKNLPADLPVRDWKKDGGGDRFNLFSLASASFELIGWPEGAATLRRIAQNRDSVALDGLLAIWQFRGQD